MRNFSLILVFALALASCGKQDDSQTADGRDLTTAQQQKPLIVTEQELQYTNYAATEMDLPACDSKRQGALAYVNSLEAFKACQSGTWTAVTIKGKDGAAGTAGKDAPFVEQNEWLDGATGKKWLLGNAGQQMNSPLLCTGSYRPPTIAELSDACYRGIFKVYGAKLGGLPATNAWGANADVVRSTDCQNTTQAGGVVALILCVQK